MSEGVGMSQTIELRECGLSVVILVTDDKDVRLLHFSTLPPENTIPLDEKQQQVFRLVELQVTGENQDDHHGSKHTGTLPAKRLRYVRHHDYHSSPGRKLEIEMHDPVTGLTVISHLQFYDSISVVRSWTVVTNHGTAPVGLEYVSSFALTGLAKEGLQQWDEKMYLHIPHNTWCGEAQWRRYTLPELGLSRLTNFSTKRLAYDSIGTWSTSQFLPLGVLTNRETGTSLFWQIEHNGSWHWEISDIAEQLYLHLSGPTEQESHWWKVLAPAETFTSVPVAVGSVHGGETEGFEQAIEELTRYRRALRRPNRDDETLPVIFNDYMNTLEGDPTTQKLLPLIQAAAEIGCEYFCIDAGWYADGPWWDSVGLWLPSRSRFPGGIEQVLSAIKERGMIPGLWLELEVVGINSPLAREVPDDWFFCRHGKRVIDHGRYQLDFRNPQVRAHADKVLDRLVSEYGVGYIKMDYNINAGIGTEVKSDSAGDGLLQHNRAYLDWLDSIFARYPNLVVENCGSGGMRMDYALLSRHSIQSSSDQTDYRRTAAIAAACPSAVTPEQCGVWSYPLPEGDEEEAIFNMVNALLLRIHQSGLLTAVSPERRALVKEAITLYKQIRQDIPHSIPFWPLGVPAFADQWLSLALHCHRTTYLAVWRLESANPSHVLPIKYLKGKEVQCDCIYPSMHSCQWQWQSKSGALSVSLPRQNSARIFRIIDGSIT
jgi:alpha-galactosidase